MKGWGLSRHGEEVDNSNTVDPKFMLVCCGHFTY